MRPPPTPARRRNRARRPPPAGRTQPPQLRCEGAAVPSAAPRDGRGARSPAAALNPRCRPLPTPLTCSPPRSPPSAASQLGLPLPLGRPGPAPPRPSAREAPRAGGGASGRYLRLRGGRDYTDRHAPRAGAACTSGRHRAAASGSRGISGAVVPGRRAARWGL